MVLTIPEHKIERDKLPKISKERVDYLRKGVQFKYSDTVYEITSVYYNRDEYGPGGWSVTAKDVNTSEDSHFLISDDLSSTHRWEDSIRGGKRKKTRRRNTRRQKRKSNKIRKSRRNRRTRR